MRALSIAQISFVFLAFFLELAFVVSLARSFPRARGERPFALWRALGIASILATTTAFVLTVGQFGSL